VGDRSSPSPATNEIKRLARPNHRNLIHITLAPQIYSIMFKDSVS
jgi:hypothetical protein